MGFAVVNDTCPYAAAVTIRTLSPSPVAPATAVPVAAAVCFFLMAPSTHTAAMPPITIKAVTPIALMPPPPVLGAAGGAALPEGAAVPCPAP